MYVPDHFAETDPARLHDFIEQNSFGLLITQDHGVPFATHLPFLLERTTGSQGCLVGHMARANPQWKVAQSQTSLAVFSGPHAYISPTWYQEANTVPTWNYTAVHVYGRVQILEAPEEVLQIVRDSVDVYEAGMPRPWSFDDFGVFAERMLTQIVGFRIAIDRIEGKFKLNQNHPLERRKKVIRALREQTDANARDIAAMMESMLPGED